MIQWVRVARYYSHFHISHLVMWLKIKYSTILLYSLKSTIEREWVCKKEKTKTTTTAMTTNAEQSRWKWMKKWQWSRMRWYENSCASWFIFSGKPTHLSQSEWDMHSMHIAHCTLKLFEDILSENCERTCCSLSLVNTRGKIDRRSVRAQKRAHTLLINLDKCDTCIEMEY